MPVERPSFLRSLRGIHPVTMPCQPWLTYFARDEDIKKICGDYVQLVVVVSSSFKLFNILESFNGYLLYLLTTFGRNLIIHVLALKFI